MRDYCAAWAAGDREAWLDTFAADATQEDPVGATIRRGRDDIGGFWDDAMAGYDSIDIRERALRVVDREAALEWTIVARRGDEWRTFDGVDVFTFTSEPKIESVRAYWEEDDRPWTSMPPSTEPAIRLERWSGPWADDDPDANFKHDVALYSKLDPLTTLTVLSERTAIPVGTLVRYVLARWTAAGAESLLAVGPSVVERMWTLCVDAEEAAADEARLAAYDALRQIVSWLRVPLDDG